MFVALLAASIGSFGRAAPPPPPPQFIQSIVERLLPTPTASGFAGYAGLFADDFTVTANGKTIAASKEGWLTLERPRLGKVSRFVYGFAADSHSILILDRFDDRSDEHCPPGDHCIFDPRWAARALRYEIGADRLVHRIRILQTASIVRTPKD